MSVVRPGEEPFISRLSHNPRIGHHQTYQAAPEPGPTEPGPKVPGPKVPGPKVPGPKVIGTSAAGLLESGPKLVCVDIHVVIDLEYELSILAPGSQPLEEEGGLQGEVRIRVVERLDEQVLVLLSLGHSRVLQTKLISR